MDSRDPYAGADRATSRRFQAGLLGLCGLLTLAFLPFEPVDDQIGDAGWAIAAGLGLAAIAGAALMRRREPGFDDLLVIAYTGIAGIALLNYLAGGGSSAYEDLYVLWLGTGAAHPPRRALPHLAVLLVALALPLTYEDTSGDTVKDLAAEALILVVLGALLTAYQAGIRRQRAGLEAGAAVERRLARVDELTGLGNRRAINDQYGHVEGDSVLRDVSRAMERALRANDRCFRWGGDEFVVVMPGTELETAGQVIERMAEEVGEACRAPDGRPIGLTWGVARLDSGGTAEDLLAAADLSLLERKTEKRR